MTKKNKSYRLAKIKFARSLRSRQTPGEKILWNHLRAKKFHRIKFKRQKPIGPYIVDFFSAQYKLIIEIDGYSHYQPGAFEYDRRRQHYLESKGFKVIRFTEFQTRHDTDYVLEEIGRNLDLYAH